MKILFNHILQHKLTPNQLYLLYCIKNNLQAGLINVQSEARELLANGWLMDGFKLTQKAKDMLIYTDSLFTKVKAEVSRNTMGADFLLKIQEWQKIFPPGRPAKHGHLIRTNEKELEGKFTWFFNTYPKYNWDMVMAATSYYVADSRLTGFEYLQVSKYFISKQDSITREIKSDLASYCEDLVIPAIIKPIEQVHPIAA
jgi:hypothetical protein